MRARIVSLLFSALVSLRAQPLTPAQVLTQAEVEALEVKDAKDPRDREAQTLLASNYVFFLLGVTKTAGYIQVKGYDKAKAESEFAVHARNALTGTKLAILAGEGGYALWNFNAQVLVHRSLKGDTVSTRLSEGEEATLAASLIDRAVELEPGNATWRSYRSSVLQMWGGPQCKKLDPLTAFKIMKGDLDSVTGLARSHLLTSVARQAVRAGQWTDARELGEQLLDETRAMVREGWDTGNQIFHGNLILGQVALHRGDTAAAAQYLLAAGATQGSPQLNSFGPNMVLARDLLDAGVGREQVVEFLELCTKFWKMDRGQLRQWIVLVKNGVTPDFGHSIVR